MLKKTGVLIAFATVMLQLAVILQALLPEQYQVSPVCEKISAIVFAQSTSLKNSATVHLNETSSQAHVARSVVKTVQKHAPHLTHAQSHQPHHDHVPLMLQQQQAHSHDHQSHNHHDSQHLCQYCVVYGLLIMPPLVDVAVVFLRSLQRLVAFQQLLQHVYFALQRLYLVPQGRAPPYF